jgi:hypothetical protein
LHGNTSVEDISEALPKIDYVISLKQITAKCPTPEGGVTKLPHLFLVTQVMN